MFFFFSLSIGLNDYTFDNGEKMHLSTTSVNKPRNLYINNIPMFWTKNKLQSIFGAYGPIEHSKIGHGGIAFVQYKYYKHALNAMNALNNQIIAPHSKLKIYFTKTYHDQLNQQKNRNKNNLYINNLPPNDIFNECDLQSLFCRYGAISNISKKGDIAFVR